MEHWAERYVGHPYAQDDCAQLAARVNREVFGREIRLPVERAAGLRGLTRQIEDLKAEVAARTDAPSEGDAVLMVSRGRLEHIGVYCEIGGAPYVLHALRNAGHACLHRLCDLDKIGLTLEGCYRWI